MKKLLALVLCVMLFVSVIPTSAFAAVSGSAIDLRPAYTARNNLFAALGILGEAHMYKNAITGIRGFENKDNKAELEAGPVTELITALQNLEKDPTKATGMSYYGLASKVAPTVVKAYNMAGNIAVAGAAKAIGVKDDDAKYGWSGKIGDALGAVAAIQAAYPAALS